MKLASIATTAKEVKVGQRLSFGWSQWMTVTNIETRLLKNGKAVLVFTGDSEATVVKGSRLGGMKLPALPGSTVEYKPDTQVRVATTEPE